MRCSIFNCDKKHMNQCCALCPDLRRCKNPCLNHPDRCGKLRAETPREIAVAAGVGIDNRDGDAWTEEFSTEAACVRWLVEDVPREECGP